MQTCRTIGDPAEKISSAEIISNLVAANATGSLPRYCQGVKSNKSSECRLEFSTEELLSIKGLKLRLSIDSKNLVEIFTPYSETVQMSAYQDVDGKKLLLPIVDLTLIPQAGLRLYSGLIILKKESEAIQSSLVVDSVILIPGIVASVQKDRQPVCLMQSLNAASLNDDVIIIQHQDAQRPSFKVQSLTNTAPFAACAPL